MRRVQAGLGLGYHAIEGAASHAASVAARAARCDAAVAECRVAKVGAVGLEAADVNDVHIREFLGDHLGSIHEAEGGRDDHIKTLASQGAGNLFRIDTFCTVFNLGGVDARNIILDIETANIV